MNGYEEYKHVVLGSDHAGFKLKGKIGEFLFGHGLEICDMVPVYHEGILFPDVAKSVCKKVANCSRTLGILVCGTGIGMTIAANSHTGIYAALLYDDFTSELCRRHNNANVLVFGARTMTIEEVCHRIDIFLLNEFEGGKYANRNRSIDNYSKGAINST